jgi:hypothetical protein
MKTNLLMATVYFLAAYLWAITYQSELDYVIVGLLAFLGVYRLNKLRSTK